MTKHDELWEKYSGAVPVHQENVPISNKALALILVLAAIIALGYAFYLMY